jgi:hypothetical protein
MTDRYEKIRKALEMEPTPGEWYWSDEYFTPDGRKTWSLLGDGGFGILSCDGEENSPQSVNAAAAELIAACDPDTIRELLDERDALRAEVERLKSMTAVTMGVGSGDGNLFVHGDYKSIKAVQAIVLERDALREELAKAKASAALDQVKGGGFWPEIPKNGGPDWTGFD